MRDAVLARIDDRLIHGQVATSWIKVASPTVIVVVDDATAKDNFMSRLLKGVAPAGVTVEVFSVEDGVAYFGQDPQEGERIFLLSKTPEVMEALIESGLDLRKIYLGNMGDKPGRTRFHMSVSCSESEVACFKRLIDRGVEVVFQSTTSTNAVNLKSIIK